MNEPHAISITQTSASVLLVSHTGSMTRVTSLKPFSRIEKRSSVCANIQELTRLRISKRETTKSIQTPNWHVTMLTFVKRLIHQPPVLAICLLALFIFRAV
jgi:hypothetical protein